MSSPKTTTLGILAIVGALCSAISALIDGNPATVPDWGAVASAVTAGIGLIVARDNNVSSEKAGAK